MLHWIARNERCRLERILDGKGEAHLIALACSQAPEGCVRWTLELLADKLVELNLVESISYRTVQRTLKKTGCSLIGEKDGSSRRGA